MEKDNLLYMFNIVSAKIPKEQWRYFHRLSIKNFIFHINLIKGKTERNNTIEILCNCLNDVELNFEPDIDYSIYLFNNYLKFIVPTYRNRLGFSAIPNKKALVVFSIILIGIFYLLLNYFFWEILFCTLLLLFILSKLIKFLKSKVYGFGY